MPHPQNCYHRICFCLQVKRDRLPEYKERHRAVWPAPGLQADEQMRPLPEVVHLR